jgi:hypothetical protein
VGIPCGFEAVSALEAARLRLSQLASLRPGEYFIFDFGTKQIVGRLVSTSEQVTYVNFSCNAEKAFRDAVP